MKTWRDLARPIIQKVLRDTQGWPEKKVRKALHDAYPFGPRKYWPYKIWLDEIKIQRGKKRKTWRVSQRKIRREKQKAKENGQMEMEL